MIALSCWFSCWCWLKNHYLYLFLVLKSHSLFLTAFWRDFYAEVFYRALWSYFQTVYITSLFMDGSPLFLCKMFLTIYSMIMSVDPYPSCWYFFVSLYFVNIKHLSNCKVRKKFTGLIYTKLSLIRKSISLKKRSDIYLILDVCNFFRALQFKGLNNINVKYGRIIREYYNKMDLWKLKWRHR